MSKHDFAQGAPPTYDSLGYGHPQSPTTASSLYPTDAAGGYAPPQSTYLSPQAGYPSQYQAQPQQGFASPNNVVIQSNYSSGGFFGGRQQQVTISGNQINNHPTNTVVIQSQPFMRTSGAIQSQYPIPYNPCPNCNNSITTSRKYVTGNQTWIAAGALCLFGMWPCAPIPFCMDSCKDVEHYCPSCNKYFGKYQRIAL